MRILRDEQNEAVDFLFERDHAIILAKVGFGKTAIACTLIKDLIAAGYAKRFLILAPKRVCTDVWPLELPMWAPRLTFSVVTGTPAERERLLKQGQVAIINFDNLQWLCEQEWSFDGLLIDELSILKNPGVKRKKPKKNAKGKRFAELFDRIDEFKYRYGMTGTFTSNGLEDCYGQCKIISDKILGRSKGAFMQQYFYCTNPQFQEFEPRRGAYQQVMDRIKPWAYIADTERYEASLPPIHYVDVEVEMPEAARKAYAAMKRDLVVKFPDRNAVALNAAVVVGKLAQQSAGFVYRSWEEANPDKPGDFIRFKDPIRLSEHKLDALQALLDENQHEPTIVFYWYEEEREMLRERFPQVVVLNEHDDAVDRWNAGKIPILLMHPRSGGHGLNLQHGGATIVWHTLPYSDDLYTQCNGRLHRGGQTKPVYVYHLMTRGAIDHKILGALRDKRSLSEFAMECLKND